MTKFESIVNTLNGIVWGEYVLIPLLALVGIYLTLGLKALTWRQIIPAFRTLWQSRSRTGQAGEIPPFQALMTALSATIGTGNIAGVATAIVAGGPGAVFWMWLIALFGMATKYAEAVLAVQYRQQNKLGQYVGGPMYYIKNGLGEHWHWLASAFALFGMLAAFGIGNLVQSNSVAAVVNNTFGVNQTITGVFISVLAAIVIIGGIKRIGEVAAKLVPLMASAYIISALVILITHIHHIPEAFGLIIHHAFNETAATGGFAGATVWAAIRFGVARGIFSNEAGLGSAPIAHAAAQTSDPVKQGKIAMLGTLIDTLIICSMTAFVILVTGSWDSGANGAALSSDAFASGIPGIGGYVVAIALSVFAFTTVLGWSYYGERCAGFLFGVKCILPYRIAWILMLFIGAVISKIEIVWNLSDLLNGLMALPNLIALLLLSPIVFKLSKQ